MFLFVLVKNDKNHSFMAEFRIYKREKRGFLEPADCLMADPMNVLRTQDRSDVLAITDLTNYVQPRLRYMLGDMGTLSTEECCCGRRLPLLTHIDGREDDLLIGPNGALVHGNIIGQLLRPLDGLRAFQFRQHAADRATLYLVKSTSGAPLDENVIHNLLAKALPNVKTEIMLVPEIKPAASGKTRYAIRECPLPR